MSRQPRQPAPGAPKAGAQGEPALPEAAPPAGIIVLDKPAGAASNRVLSRVKHLLGAGGRRGPKMGFLGTLDPIATGVLPVFCGKATRLIAEFERLDKTYRVTVRLGQRTDTFDGEGAVIAEADTAALTEADVRAAVQGFEGGYTQRVPAFSAVKIDGVPAYRLARDGRDVPERTRAVRIADVRVESVHLGGGTVPPASAAPQAPAAPPAAAAPPAPAWPEVTFRLTVSAGTYVRTVADDLGSRLGVGGHVIALRRLACGSLFTLENSITLDRIEKALESGDRGFLLNPSAFLPDYLPLRVDASAERQLRDGRTIPLPETLSSEVACVGPPGRAKAIRPCGTLVAIGEVVRAAGDGLQFRPSKVLV